MTAASASDSNSPGGQHRPRAARLARRAIPGVALALAGWLCAAPARAAAPVVDFLYPAGGQQGTSVTVATGDAKGDAKIDPWPATAWTDAPGLAFKPGEANGTFVAEVAKDAVPGPHLVRVYNGDGTSAPRVFVVGRHREVQEGESAKEPNDNARAAQPAGRLPAVLNGRLDKAGDVDSWAADVEAGRWLVAELACRRLGSPVDPALHLLDPDGAVVAFAHDTFGLDPLLAYRAPRAGRYVLQVAGFAHPPAADVRYAGSRASVYRLSVTAGPYARQAFPACVVRGQRTPVRLFGWNLDGAEDDGLAIEVDPVQVPPTADSVAVIDARIDNALRLPLTDLPGKREAEPNDAAADAQRLELPAAIDGRLGRPGDVDRFAFSAKKGEPSTAVVRAAALGSPIDPVLTVADAAGKQLARNDDDDDDRPDARLEWTAPSDGTYVVSLADLTRRGGPECVYRLEIARPANHVTVTADAHSYRLEPGTSADVKVRLRRDAGQAAPLVLVVAGLPEGVTATTPEVPAKGGTVTVTLTAAADARAANQPFRVAVVSKGDGHPVEWLAAFSLGRDQLIDRTRSLWITVPVPAKGK